MLTEKFTNPAGFACAPELILICSKKYILQSSDILIKVPFYLMTIPSK